MLLLGFQGVFQLKSQCSQYTKPEIRYLCKESTIHPVNPPSPPKKTKWIMLAVFCLSDISLGIRKNLPFPLPQ